MCNAMLAWKVLDGPYYSVWCWKKRPEEGNFKEGKYLLLDQQSLRIVFITIAIVI